MKLTTEIRNKCKYFISLYPNLSEHIQTRRLELMFGSREEDENIGGSSSGRVGQPTEQTAMLLITDPLLIELERVGGLLEMFEGIYPPWYTKLVEGLYFEDKSKYEVSKDMEVSVRTLERRNKEFLTDFAERMGMFEERGEWD